MKKNDLSKYIKNNKIYVHINILNKKYILFI